VETIVDYLNEVKPDICKQLARNPAMVITAFFQADPILKAATEHPEWQNILADAKEYLAELEAEETEAAKPPN